MNSNTDLSTAWGRFHVIGFLEGTSALILFFIAMPLKYMFDMPLAVKYVGWAHGVLFMLYLVALVQIAFRRRWSLVRVFAGFVASVLPFGPFVFDARIRKEEEARMRQKA